MAKPNSAEKMNIRYEEEYSTDAMTGGPDKRRQLYYRLIESMKKAEERALNQIEEMRYADGMYAQGYQKVIKYGVAFYRKSCLVGRCEV